MVVSRGWWTVVLVVTLCAAGPAQAYPRLGPGAPPPSNHCNVAPRLRYYGGPVLQNVKVYNVNWGANIDATFQAQLPLFYADVVASSYLDWLAEYNTIGVSGLDGQPGSNQGISRGTYAGSVSITPSLCPGTGAPGSCTVTEAQLEAELVTQITAGNLPAPTKGCDGLLDTVYMVNFHNSVKVTNVSGQASCVDFCGFHGKAVFQGTSFAYAMLPDTTAGGCGGAGCGPGTALANLTSVASHELAEAITDPLSPAPGRPLAWLDSTCGEIADICILQYGSINPSGTTWTVTQLWSNAANDCIVTKASLPAVCTGPSSPAGCRPCACSDDHQGAPGEPGCAGDTPRCEADPGNIKHGFCTQCTSSADCTSPATCTKSGDVAIDDTCAGPGGANDGGAGGDDAATGGGGASPGGCCRVGQGRGDGEASTLLAIGVLGAIGSLRGRRRR